MHSRYIGLFLRTQKYRSEISDLAAGTNINNLKAEHFAQILVPLAPFAEQRRIVAKLEQLLATVDTCQQRLTRVPVLLKRFRQSVLAAACSGRLTADWREENPDVVDAAPLVQRIDEARRRRSLGRVRLASVEVLDGDDRPEDEIPSSWKWVRFGSVIGELRNGISPRPSVTPPGTPVLRISAARSGSVDLTDVRYMPNGLEFLPLFAVRDDDLLFTRYNGSIELLGVCGRVRGLGRKAMLYPDKLMRVRFDHEVILPAYAEVFFQVQAVHERIVAKSKSSAGQNGVSGSDIKAQPFALAPIPEQQEIVRRVEGLFSLGDQIESRLVGVLTQVARLAPSLLAKAFRGELVPTEAELARREGRDYEPASVLLERVQQQHDSEPARRSRHRAESSSGNAELKGQQARRAVIRR
jgi:type I restriction enzyme S subunit